MQRAVVIVSDMHPQTEFFNQLVGILASTCLSDIPGTLRDFYETVSGKWPEPQPLRKYDSL